MEVLILFDSDCNFNVMEESSNDLKISEEVETRIEEL